MTPLGGGELTIGVAVRFALLGPFVRARYDASAVGGIGGQNTVVPHQIEAPGRHQGGQFLYQFRALAGPRALLVTDPGLVQAGLAEQAQHALQNAGLTTTTFSAVGENPTTEHVAAGVHHARTHGPINLIVALGGGSAMDCAKGINFLLTNGGQMQDYQGYGKAAQPMLPSIGIPTTAGTGSEAQSYALITCADTNAKMACGDRKARFHIAILAPNVLTSVPQRVRADAGPSPTPSKATSPPAARRSRKCSPAKPGNC